jgi:hypothetical protein
VQVSGSVLFFVDDLSFAFPSLIILPNFPYTEKKSLNFLSSTSAVLDWLEEHYGMQFHEPRRTSILV